MCVCVCVCHADSAHAGATPGRPIRKCHVTLRCRSDANARAAVAAAAGGGGGGGQGGAENTQGKKDVRICLHMNGKTSTTGCKTRDMVVEAHQALAYVLLKSDAVCARVFVRVITRVRERGRARAREREGARGQTREGEGENERDPWWSTCGPRASSVAVNGVLVSRRTIGSGL